MKNISNPAQNSSLPYSDTTVAGVCCPVCGFTKGKLLYTVTPEDAAQHFVLKEANPIRNKNLAVHIAGLWGQKTCDVVSCDSCDFIFANPYIAGDSTFYTLAYERTGYPKWKWEYQQTADAISEIASRPNQSPLRLLEIGAGDGAFVRKVSPKIIPKENILCLEFSDYGRNKILEYGIKCQGDDIRSLSASKFDNGFELICMFQVLEHMDRLNELFKQLNALSNSHTHLYVSVPNAAQIEFNETNGCLLDMPPNHIGRWNLQAFERIGTAYGWKVAEYQVEPFNMKETLKQQVAYRYLRVSQDASTLANKIEQMKSEKIRRIFRTLCAGIYSLTRLNSLVDAVSDKSRGDSQWIHFVKNNDNSMPTQPNKQVSSDHEIG
jgi:Methyltransferase domain